MYFEKCRKLVKEYNSGKQVCPMPHMQCWLFYGCGSDTCILYVALWLPVARVNFVPSCLVSCYFVCTVLSSVLLPSLGKKERAA